MIIDPLAVPDKLRGTFCPEGVAQLPRPPVDWLKVELPQDNAGIEVGVGVAVIFEVAVGVALIVGVGVAVAGGIHVIVTS